MDPEVLRDQLAKLHEELKSVRNVDPRSSQLLGEVQADIQRLLNPPSAAARGAHAPGVDAPAAAAPGAAGARDQASLAGRLEKIAVQFEADHPTLAASSRRLIDLLGKVGL